MPLGTEVGLGRGHIVLDGHPAPPRKGSQQPPTFRPMSIVAKRSPISATAEMGVKIKLLFNFQCIGTYMHWTASATVLRVVKGTAAGGSRLK